MPGAAPGAVAMVAAATVPWQVQNLPRVVGAEAGVAGEAVAGEAVVAAAVDVAATRRVEAVAMVGEGAPPKVAVQTMVEAVAGSEPAHGAEVGDVAAAAAPDEEAAMPTVKRLPSLTYTPSMLCTLQRPLHRTSGASLQWSDGQRCAGYTVHFKREALQSVTVPVLLTLLLDTPVTARTQCTQRTQANDVVSD
eukprot:m.62626 g.62626  ORF g.62626 m.62626 type:complete len:193 (-) comp17702_c2_seq1:3649-4227(-)